MRGMVVKKNSICFVIPSLHPGGMERVMSELIEQFSKKQDLEIHLILYGIKRDIFFSIPGTVFIHRPAFGFNNKKRIYHSIKTIFFLRKTISVIQPTTVLSFGERWNSFVLLALLKKKARVFVSDRCQPDKSLGKVHDALRSWLYPKACGIIAQTGKAKEIYLKKYKHANIKVIGNPIGMISLENAPPRENIVLSVGRLIESKHHDKLIEIFARINRPNWKLIIVGDDALKQKNMERLQLLIQQLNFEGKIVLAGKQKNVNQFYLKSRVFAFTSSSEGFPNVLGEAQAAGLPVIAFDCVAGPADIVIDNQNGFLIPLNDDEQFEKKLSILMDNEALREKFGEHARQSIRRFDTSSIAEEYYKFLMPAF